MSTPPTLSANGGTAAAEQKRFLSKERRLFRWSCIWASFASLALASSFALKWLERREIHKLGPVPPPVRETFAITYPYLVGALISRYIFYFMALLMTIFLIRWILVLRHNRQQWPSFTEGS